MPWQQIKIQVRSHSIESVEQYLLDNGAASVSYLDAEDQPIFQLEPGSTPLWDHTILLGLFAGEKDLSAVMAWLALREEVANKKELNIECLEDQDWERSWMGDFQAMQFGENLWICPSWQTPPNDKAVNIMLDPGLAFGSGSHATTSMCLTWLESAALKGATVIDYGCGSGVLAIAAALLGASKVHAVDNDPQAIVATVDNSYRNEIEDGVITAYLPEALPKMQADILLANILAEPLLDLAATFSKLIKPGGSIVLSGLLDEQADSIIKSYSRWFEMAEPQTKEEWVRLNGTRLN